MLNELDKAAYKVWVAESLERCATCGRSFGRDAYKRHVKGCNSDSFRHNYATVDRSLSRTALGSKHSGDAWAAYGSSAGPGMWASVRASKSFEKLAASTMAVNAAASDEEAAISYLEEFNAEGILEEDPDETAQLNNATDLEASLQDAEASPVVTHPLTIQSGRLQNTTYWACNVHAFCYVCENDDGSLNKYCEAVLQKYSQKNAWNVGTPSQVKTFVTRTKDSFWCTSDVINAIENSTFLALIQPGEALASGGWI